MNKQLGFIKVNWNETAQDKIDSVLEKQIRDIVNKQVLPVTYPADTFSGIDLDHYDFDDPEQLISDVFYYIKGNFRWKKKPDIKNFQK